MNCLEHMERKMEADTLSLFAALSGSVQRAVVIEISPAGRVSVETPGDPPAEFWCDVLQTGSSAGLELKPGMVVLVVMPTTEDGAGCVLGAVGPYCPPAKPAATPERTIVRAEKELVLECGESSLTMTAEGKVLLKGVDVTSRARRSQRIRGGSVHIN
jgi:hypothetical protein